MRKEEKDLLRDEIGDLITAGGEDIEFPTIEIDPIEPINLGELDNETRSKAQKIVLSCMKLYFDANIISKSEFMAAKAAVSTSNIKTLFRQIRLSEHMVDKIVNGIDGGDMNPRLFEVAGQLQNNIIDMLKNVQLHVISMQEEFRRMQGELPSMQATSSPIEIQNNSGDKVYTNAKSLLKDLEDDD